MSHLRVSSAGLLARVSGASFPQVCHEHNTALPKQEKKKKKTNTEKGAIVRGNGFPTQV